MALVLKDRVRESSSTTGTGTVTLGGAYDGYRTFASCVPTGSVVYYCIHNTATGYESEWEVGYGTFTLSGTTLSRTTVYSSSNSNELVNFSAGIKEVFITYPAEQAVFQETNGNLKLISGVIEVSVDGTEGTTLPNATFQAFATVDGYIQNNIQNLSDGSDASGDFVATNDQGDDETFYVDVGINSSNFSSASYPIYSPNSTYLFGVGDSNGNPSDLYVGSGDGDVILHAGGWATTNVAATISGTDQSVTFEEAVNVGGALDVTGAATFGSTVTLNANPSTALEAATKQYVDSQASSAFVVHTAVRAATTSNLATVYNNGTAGVGATLTADTSRAFTTLDGVTGWSLNQRVLVKNQTNAFENGIYYLSALGETGVSPWVLTRATDFDTAALGEIDNNAYVYVTAGSTQIGTSWVLAQLAEITVGTTALPFDLFAQPVAYTVEAPLTLDGTTLSLSGTVAATNGGTGTNTVTTGDLLYGSASNTWSKLAAGGAYKSLVMNGSGTNVEWNAVALNQSGAVSGALPATNGGTAQSSYALGDTLYSSATNTLSKLSGNTTTTKKYLQQQGNGSVSAAPSWQQVAAADISGLAASATTDTTNASNISSGTLPSARISGAYTGITQVGTLTAGTWTASTIGVGYGGTGLTSYTTGDIVYASGSTTLAKLADVATGNVLISGGVGVAPSYGKVGLTTHITGTLAVANGGTGATSLTGYLYGNGTSAVTASATIPGSAISGNISGNAAYATTAGSTTYSLTPGSYLTGSAFNGGAAQTFAVDATSANTASKVVARDGSGNFSAGTITAALSGNATTATTASSCSGNAATATALQTARTINGVSFNGTANINVNTNNTLTRGSYLTGDNFNGSAATTWAVDATSANTASKVVARDASGNFSAGTITASLSGNATTATSATSATTATTATNATNVTLTTSATSSAFKVPFANTTVSTTGNYGLLQDSAAEFTYNPSTNTLTVGTVVAAVTGNVTGNVTGSSGSCTGNAATATTLQTARTINGVSFNGSANITVTANTTNTLTLGSYLTGSNFNGSAATTWAVDATSANTASKVVARDASGNFSAGTITATLSGNASTATTASSCSGNAATATNISNTGTVTLATATESNSIYITAPSYTTDNPVKLLNFDWYGNLFSMGNIRSGATPSSGFGIYYTASGGSRTEIARFGTDSSLNVVGALKQGGNQVLHAGNYNSYAPTLTGTGASGTWGINVSGNAATATSATSATTASSCSGNAATATLATKASTLAQGGGSGTGMTFNWSGQSGQPTWLWGSNDGTNIYVWNPSNFSVNYATTAGSAPANGGTSSQVTINYNNDSNSTYQMLWGSGNSVYGTSGIYCNPYTDYMYSGSFYCSDWFRSSGGTGWYNESYGGGIYMEDATWVRVYNSKAFYVANQIAATGNITAYYSDERLKTKVGDIENALDKVDQLSGFLYVENDLAKSLGYNSTKQQVALSAQAVQKVQPEAVSLAPFDMETKEDGTIVSKSGEEYLTVDYARLVPLLVEAIKELRAEVKALKGE